MSKTKLRHRRPKTKRRHVTSRRRHIDHAKDARWLFLILIITAIVAVASTSLKYRFAGLWYQATSPSQLPQAQNADDFINKPILTTTTETPEPVPVQQPETPKPLAQPNPEPVKQETSKSINLNVPFTSQAPHATWDAKHKEFCEEASVAMVGRFFANQSFSSADDADSEMMKLYDWEIANLGYFEDTDAALTKRMVEENYPLRVALLQEPSANDLRDQLNNGKAIILPAAGRELGNPYFQQPGPIYHMLVIKGYTSDGRFITNDPGTRRGANFIYSEKTIMEAMGDFNGGDPANGAKVVLVVEK